MYTVVSHYHLNIPVDQIQPKFEEGIPTISAMQGFQGVHLIKNANDRATIILFWDNASDAENAAKLLGPTWLAANIMPHLASPQDRSAGEVIIRHQK